MYAAVSVTPAETNYRSPRRSGEQFVVRSRLERFSAARFVFLQDIERIAMGSSRPLVVTAKTICAAMDASGKPILPTAIEHLLEPGDAGDARR